MRDGWASWIPWTLPGSGGPGEQDAKTMQTLRYIAVLENDVIARLIRERRRREQDQPHE